MVSYFLGFSVCLVGVPLGAQRGISISELRFWLLGNPCRRISVLFHSWLWWHRLGWSIFFGPEGIGHRVYSLFVVGGDRM